MELKNGKYRGRGIQGVLTTSGDKECVMVEFELLEHEGQSLTWWGYFTDAAMEITFKALRNCGWTGTDLQDLTGLDANEVILVVENETYQGKTRPKVKWVNSLGGLGLAEPLSVDAAKSFAARMKGALLKFDQDNGTKPKAKAAPKARPSSGPGARPEPPPPTDSDAPPF